MPATSKTKRHKPKAAARAAPVQREHLLLTIAVDRATGVSTVFGNATSELDHEIMGAVLAHVGGEMQTKRIGLAVARATAEAKGSNPQ